MRREIDALFSRRYDIKSYNCAHFVGDAAMILTGRDIRAEIGAFQPGAEVHPMFRHSFERLSTPRDGAVALMTGRDGETHVGLYWKGKIMHMTEKGPEYFPPPVVMRDHSRLRYYGVREHEPTDHHH